MILITGGAGFIGSHLADKLVEKGYDVSCVDILEKQVHADTPGYLNKKVKYIFCDVLDLDKYKKVLQQAEYIFHFASRVGVGQSQYEIDSYTKTNIYGTAKLLQFFIDQKKFPKKFVIAASMSSYGEGVYNCKKCGVVRPPLRKFSKSKNDGWDPLCPICNRSITSVPTSENVSFQSNSIYAITKQVQEQMVLNWGISYNVPVVSLRFFNVYGVRQSLNNPYTGASAIFINRVLNNKPPVIFEDGLQSRSFISVHDIVQSCILAINCNEANYEVFNVGVQPVTTILDLARKIVKISGKKLTVNITNEFRSGDIRHCTSDITKIQKRLGYKQTITLDDGLKKLYEHYKKQKIEDHFDKAYKELKDKKLVT
ncbi:MAG: SDR family NAD(P)-dependent oxidoreductase [Planctomycetes bacterium]|nr:SDR family NAD(P)-dependent oxidoreductase [Planctomycetota bacterium]